MDPHKGTCRFPLIEDVPFRKPRGSAFVMQTTRNIVIYGRIWGR